MKISVAIIGSMVLVGAIAFTLGHKTGSQPIEPVISGSSVIPETTVEVKPTLEAPKETKTTNSVKTLIQTTIPSIKLADLVVPKTEAEQDKQIDQNTIKNVEQDSRLDHLDAVVNTPPPVPTPLPPAPQPSPTPDPTPVPVPEPIEVDTIYDLISRSPYDIYPFPNGTGFSLSFAHLIPSDIIELTFQNQTFTKTGSTNAMFTFKDLSDGTKYTEYPYVLKFTRGNKYSIDDGYGYTLKANQ